MKKRKFRKRKIVLALIIFLVFLALLIFGAKVYLLVNLFLGNDVLIKLSTSNENLFLVHGDSQNLSLKTDILTNPFCSVDCGFNFVDLSTGEIFENSSFSLKTIQPVTKTYLLKAPLKGTGQKLYRFNIECHSKKTFLCHTTEEIKKRNILITLNYDLNAEEKQANSGSKSYILNYLERFESIDSNLNIYQNKLIELNKTLNIESSFVKYAQIVDLTNSVNKSLENLTILWQEEDYSNLNSELINSNKSLSELELSFNSLNLTIFSIITDYNNLIENLSKVQNSLENLKKINASNETVKKINELINEFNHVSIFNRTSLLEKQIQLSLLYNHLSVYQVNETNSSLIYMPNETLIPLNLTLVNLPLVLEKPISYLPLKEQPSVCCLSNQCNECCNESCYSDKTKFPIIFIHGHDFSKSISAEYNLNIFDEMQRSLEKDGYLDAGSILISPDQENLSGILGKPIYPITIKASYYFDSYQSRDQNIILQTKQDNLDTYALRLNDIINSVKFKTNREKVIIVAHSMGGLVTRRYIQIFGENSLEKVVLIATPNHGVNGTILKYCSLFGAKLECDDMNPNSLFLNKLNNAKKPIIPIYNIIGIGCDTDGETGDRVVTNKSAYLDYARNYYINGTCDEPNFKYLHTVMVDPNKNIEVYNLVKKILKEN